MRRAMGHIRLTAALAAGVLVISACGSSGEEQSDGESPSYELGIVGDQADGGDPVEGGSLTITDYAETRSLDPTETIATAYSGGTPLTAVYDPLVRYNPDSDEFEAWLAEDLEHNDDHTEWTVTLPDDVTFSDDTPLDADAVVTSAEYYMDNEGYDATVVEPVLDDIRAEDDTTVVFELSETWTTFPAMLGQGLGMVTAPAATEGEEFEPIGAGPFELENYAPQEELVLSARDDYWGEGPYLDELRFIWLDPGKTQFDALESGDVDLAVIRDQKTVDDTYEADYPGYMELNNLGNMLLLNEEDGRPGEDPRVREAIAYAIDPEVNYERAYDGAGNPSKSVFSDLSDWHAEDVDPVPHDPEKAKELLEEAKADGFDGHINHLSGSSSEMRDEGMAIKAMLEKVGFEVDVEQSRTIADRTDRIFVEGDYDMATGAISVSEEDPFQRIYSSLHGESVANALGYDSPEMNERIAELRESEGEEERKDAIAEIERVYQEENPGVPVGPSVIFEAWQDDVHGVQPGNEQMLLFNEAWIEE